MKKNKFLHKINSQIRATEVRVAEAGVLSLSDALKLAESKGMDLVLINEGPTPPICKIMNYEKFLYEEGKKAKNKPKTLEMKEIKIGPNTAENDLTYRVKHMIEFLEKGHKIKLSMQFRGREMTYVDNGTALMLKMILAVEEYGIAENMPKLEGKNMYATIRPKTAK